MPQVSDETNPPKAYNQKYLIDVAKAFVEVSDDRDVPIMIEHGKDGGPARITASGVTDGFIVLMPMRGEPVPHDWWKG